MLNMPDENFRHIKRYDMVWFRLYKVMLTNDLGFARRLICEKPKPEMILVKS